MFNSFSISRRFLFLVISSVCFLVLFRFFLPYGDEPDFYFRVDDLLSGKLVFFSPYYYIQDFLNAFEWFGVEETFQQKSLRLVITLLLLAPFFLLVLFRNIIIKYFIGFKTNEEVRDISLRIDAIALSMLFPGMIYHLGLFAQEQITLLLSLLVFIFFKQRLILLLVLFLMSLIDIGNMIVVTFFVLFFKVFDLLRIKFGCVFLLLLLLLLSASAYMIGMDFIGFLSKLPIIGDKAAGIYHDYTTFYAYVSTKYPILLRPIITFFTFVFMTPSKLGAYLLYPVYAFMLLFSICKIMRSSNKVALVYLMVPICFVVMVVFILPGYSQAKYYIFLVPFMMYALLYVFSFNKLSCFLFISNIVVLIHVISISLVGAI